MKRYHPHASARLDWAITMIASTRGWRRVYWRIVKRYWELWI